MEIVTHSESMDAPVLLLVPKAWHLEKKEKENQGSEYCLEGNVDTTISKCTEPQQNIDPPHEQIQNQKEWLNLASSEKKSDNVVVICPSQEKANELLEQWRLKESNPLL